MKLEIACFNPAAALIANLAGADRLELCTNKAAGGLTPDYTDFQAVKAAVTRPVFVMIRTKSDDFCYNDSEFELMQTQIKTFKAMNADGFVFGILNKDHTIDTARNQILVRQAHPLPCTFHRAFDEVPDYSAALEAVIGCGFKTILTSGLSPNVNQGLNTLKALFLQAAGRIVIMPGGGLRADNLTKIKAEIPSKFCHSAAVTNDTDFPDFNEIKAMKSILNHPKITKTL